MKLLRLLGIILGVLWLGGATGLAIWPVVADAPWEETKVVEVERVITPAFTSADVLRLAQTQVANLDFPSGTNWVRCTQASYREANQIWVVTCDFRVNRDDLQPTYSRTYTFNDRTGQLATGR